MVDKHKIAVIIASTGFLFLYGIAGFMLIEGWSFVDALYMTVITISTVGFSEIRPVGDGGRIFTITLIFIGAGFFLYLAAFLVQAMVEGRLRKILGRARLDKRISNLKNHYIVCGYGRIGRSLCKVLLERKLDVVAVEKDPERNQVMLQDGVLHVVGEATDESSLLKAGIKRARGLATAVGADTDNVFLVLTAKQLNPLIDVVSRANRRETIKTLYAAGADKVISPFEIGGRRMANAILRPTVMSFLDLAFADVSTDMHIEEVPVGARSNLDGVTLRDSQLRDRLNLLVIAMKKADGSMLFNPSATTCIEAGDIVIAMGQNDHLIELEKLLQPPEA